jgi:hypothetical protein
MSGYPPNTVINVRPSRKRLIRFSNGLRPGNTNNRLLPTSIGMTYNNFHSINTIYPQQLPSPLLPDTPLLSQQPPPQKRPNWWWGGKKKTRKTKRKNRK